MLASVAAFTVISFLQLAIGATTSAKTHFSENLETHGSQRYGAIASLSRVCSQIGIDTFKRGGNAADAVRNVITLVSLLIC